MSWHNLPFLGELKQIPTKSSNSEPIDEFEIVALAKRLGISIEEMKSMSFTSLMNILISSIDDNNQETTRKATQNDIDRL